MAKVRVKIQAPIEIEADRDFSSAEQFSNIKKVGAREALNNLNQMINEAKFNVHLVKSPTVASFTYIDNF